MKKIFALSAILAVSSMMLAGCPKAQEAANAGADAAMSAGNAAADAGNKMANTAADAGNKMAGAAGAVAGALDPAKITEAVVAVPDYKGVKVEVKDGKVILTGKVKNNDLKKKLDEVVGKVAMGAKIQNMVLVGE